LQRRNFAETTIRSYVHGVSHFIPRKLITRMRPPQQRLRSSRTSIA
jgi:hypothetical protein